MERLKFGSREISYLVKSSRRRRSVAIAIDASARVTVSIPHFLKRSLVQDIVRKRAQWILDKQAHFEKLGRLYPEKTYANGEEVLLLGERYYLQIREEGNAQACETLPEPERKILLRIPANLEALQKTGTIKETLQSWYLAEASRIIKPRVKYFQSLLGLISKKVMVKKQEKRWGSCSRGGEIRFNWKLIMAPQAVIDYVIAHEICHLRHMNHSPSFWNLVATVVPDYKKHRAWLREHGAFLKV